jgi:shikimate kinase
VTANNIFLIGYRGTGKSTIARRLADKLGWSAVDADEFLEHRFGKTIRAIFAEEGEAGFRAKEAAILAEICQHAKQVIATGGGVVLRSDNRQMIKNAGFVVWLTADAQTLWNRLQADASSKERRPALTTGGLAEIVELLQAREPYYRDCANLVVDTVGLVPEEIVATILGHVT